MREDLSKILSSVDADYADLRFETKTQTLITFAGREPTQVGANRGDGYVLRVLAGGGLASVAFSRPEDAEDAISTAVRNAKLMGRQAERPVELAAVQPVVDTVRPDLTEDPRAVPLQEKIDLARRMNDIPMAHDGIATTTIGYEEIIREKHFLSTEGASVSEDLVMVALGGEIVARDGDLTQNVRTGVGGADGFGDVRGGEAHFEGQTKLALDLLHARPVQGETWDCILNPQLAGVFAHEAFGHFSEADILEVLPSMWEKMRLGTTLGSEAINIVDDPTRPQQMGFYRYDDEGTAARRTELMREGVLTGRLHSRKTAAAFGEPVTGHMIAEDYRYAPIIRMGCIYIEPSDTPLEDLLARLGDGLYVQDVKGGQTAGESFSFGAQAAWEVKNGKRTALLRDLNISGSLFRTMKGIEAVGDDFHGCAGLEEDGGVGVAQVVEADLGEVGLGDESFEGLGEVVGVCGVGVGSGEHEGGCFGCAAGEE